MLSPQYGNLVSCRLNLVLCWPLDGWARCRSSWVCIWFKQGTNLVMICYRWTNVDTLNESEQEGQVEVGPLAYYDNLRPFLATILVFSPQLYVSHVDNCHKMDPTCSKYLWQPCTCQSLHGHHQNGSRCSHTEDRFNHRPSLIGVQLLTVIQMFCNQQFISFMKLISQYLLLVLQLQS